ncbi:MAG TPA: hypothetical protein VM598_00420, partial [Bdellovibrionota bacterium]|nr:hypothetical protein [Bdellovibrionota bacterium]
MRLVLWAALLASTLAHAAPAYRLPSGQVGCSKMVESFCDTLWAPEALGNLSLQTPEGKPLGEVTLGKMPNETTFANTFFAQAQLDAKSRLPEDLRSALEKRGYFEKLDRFVNHKPFSAMTRSEVELFRALYGQIDAIAGESLSNTASSRVSRKHPGFFRLTDDRVPTHIAHDYNRAKDELEATVWKAIWSSHPRWPKLQAEFEEIRSVFLELIRAHPSASKATRERWETRIKATRLELPGTDPVQLGDAERRCASTEMNGYH